MTEQKNRAEICFKNKKSFLGKSRNVGQIEMSDKLKCRTNWNVGQIEMLDKLKMSDKLKCRTNWNVGQIENVYIYGNK
jgi:hypothetical protein